MKKLVLFLLGLSLSASVTAQTSQEQAIEYDKRTVQGVSIMVPSYSVDLVKAALQQRLEKGATLKGSNIRNVTQSWGSTTMTLSQILDIKSPERTLVKKAIRFNKNVI